MKTKRILGVFVLWLIEAAIVALIGYLNSLVSPSMEWDNLGRVWFFIGGVIVPFFPFASYTIDILGE